MWICCALICVLFSQSLDPCKRIGCEEMGGYGPLKSHPFFETVGWDDIHLQIPPKLTAYLPAMSEDDEDCYGNVSQYKIRKYEIGIVLDLVFSFIFSMMIS